ncbi:MAG: class I tRNA ligase family protein, partial [Akkermansiaceae bacterium]
DVVQAVLQHLFDAGDIYEDEYQGWYSTSAERFWTEKDLVDGKCPESGLPVDWISEKNYFFRMSKYTGQLQQWIEDKPTFLRPETRRNEVLGYLRKDVGDLCISRPTERLPWGIPLPFDDGYVTYVWFDALINYISFAGYQKPEGSELPKFDSLWPADLQIIGKDILVPAHAVYWPCMLHAMGFEASEMPTLLVHGFWNVKGDKMSKSLGNIVDPDELAEKFGPDTLRYYLCRDIRSGKDSDFDIERLVMLFNTELANDLGNLLNRSINMTKGFCNSTISVTNTDNAEDLALRECLAQSVSTYREAMDNCEVSVALQAINDHVTHCNGYLERHKPWEMKKDESKLSRVGEILSHTAESCAQLAVLLRPILPDAAAKIFGQLKKDDLIKLTLGDLKWGLLEAGHKTGKPKPVFPRIQIEEKES